MKEGLRELFDEVSPVRDFTGRSLELTFLDYKLDQPKTDESTARERNVTYEAPLRVQVQLTNLETGEIREQEVFLGDFPKITGRGTFIINGVERVVVSQLVRSAGVFFTSERSGNRNYYGAKVIPTRGAWLELETSNKGQVFVKIDRKRKLPITSLLRILDMASDQQIIDTFADVDTGEHRFIEATLERDPATSVDQALIEIYKRIRPGDLATVDNAKSLIEGTFFDFSRFDFGKVGRYKLNQTLGTELPNDKEHRILMAQDVIAIVKEVIRLNNTQEPASDIDHLKNRRIRSVGELVQLSFRRGLLRVERIIKDRMSVSDAEAVTPAQLINVRPIVAATQEFFASSQLSQFMDQNNPLSELGHKRRLNAMGPGGLTRERASFEVRDVHVSHYGRICPIETPEGPNIGLVTSLASYARINEYGFIETPYRKVEKKGNRGKVTDTVEYLDAGTEEGMAVAQANTNLSPSGFIEDEEVIVRKGFVPTTVSASEVDYIDVSPKQIVSITAALIPFLEHDDANRALMGSNMQRQAVPPLKPQAPIVGTGIEKRTAYDTGQMIISEHAGKVSFVDATRIDISGKQGTQSYGLRKFVRSNQDMGLIQRPIVNMGDVVKAGEVVADGPATDNGEIALGQNLAVAFMAWGGANFEDAVIISERVVEEDRFTSVHISRFTTDIRDTKLGPEVTTNDIPNVGAEALKDLDENGIVRIGAEVRAGDILVGKITPKGETELTAEERLLRAIFGEKARDVKDTSLRLQHGESGKVVEVKIFDRELGDDLQAGVLKKIEVSVAQVRKVQVGDKMAGRHGNKGVISEILPVEDMPYLADGTPVDIILNPLGVTSRMNLGQVLETHLGAAAQKLGYTLATPVFEGITTEEIKEERKKAGLSEDGKEQLYDGRTGDPFDQRTTVGTVYMLKLHHLVEDKMHSRSTGPYALVTQQPLGGKAMFGGQRFGEMEVWALEAYGAAHTLQEMLTVKSDDVVGRAKTYESIIQDRPPQEPQRPESFRVLVKELQSLGLNVELVGVEGADLNAEIDTEVAQAVDPNVLDVLNVDSDTERTQINPGSDAATAASDDDDDDDDEGDDTATKPAESSEAADPLGIKAGSAQGPSPAKSTGDAS